MDLEADEEPTGPRVIMRAAGDEIAVLIEPPLVDGDYRRLFFFKQDGWSYARELWCSHRLGFSDETTLSNGRTGPHRLTLEK